MAERSDVSYALEGFGFFLGVVFWFGLGTGATYGLYLLLS